jgi:hypothetical protein
MLAENSIDDKWGFLVFWNTILRSWSAWRSGEEVIEVRSAKRPLTTEVWRYRGPRRHGGVRGQGGFDRY